MSSLLRCSRLGLALLEGAVVIGLTCTLVRPVYADQGLVLPQVVITATRSERSPDDVPGAIEVLSRDAIEATGVTTLDELLDLALGSVLTNNPGRVKQLSIRGTGTGRTLILVDGRRLARGYRDNIDLGKILLGAVARVEVVRGPTSALYGSDAIGGVVNIITVKPTASDVRFDARYNAGDAPGWRGSATARARGEHAGVMASVSGFSQDRFNDDDDGLSEVDDRAVGSALVQGRYDLSARQKLDLGASFLASTREGDRFIQGQDRERDADETRTDAFVGYEALFSEQSRLSIQGYYSRFDADVALTPVPSVTDTGETQELAQLEGQFDYLFATGSQLIVGADVRREGIEEPDAALDDSLTNIGGFTQVDLGFGPDINLVAGVRVDEHSEFGSNIAPRATLAWRLNPAVRLRAGAGQGFKAPTLAQLFVPELRRRGRVTVEPNAELEPERSLGGELGVDLRLGQFNAGLTAFYTDIEDRISEVLISSEGSGGGGPPTQVFRLDNISEVETYGVELGGSIALPSQLRLTGNVTFLESAVGGSNDALAFEPRWKGFGLLGWGTTASPLRANLRVDYDGPASDGAGGRIAGATVLGLQAEYRLQQRVVVTVGVENLTEELDDTRPFRPRTIYAGIRATWP